MLFTLGDAATFCYKYQRKNRKAPEQWGQAIITAANQDKLHLVQDARGLVGVAIVTFRHVSKIIYVHEIVAIRTGFITLIAQARNLYPDYDFAGLRKDKPKHYKKEKLWAAIHQNPMRQQKT